jgi:hypothetical protein
MVTITITLSVSSNSRLCWWNRLIIPDAVTKAPIAPVKVFIQPSGMGEFCALLICFFSRAYKVLNTANT